MIVIVHSLLDIFVFSSCTLEIVSFPFCEFCVITLKESSKVVQWSIYFYHAKVNFFTRQIQFART